MSYQMATASIGTEAGDPAKKQETPPQQLSTASMSSSTASKGVKLALLVVLCLQNAVYTMLRRYRCGNDVRIIPP